VAIGFDQSAVAFDSGSYTFDGVSLVVDVPDTQPDTFMLSRSSFLTLDRGPFDGSSS
jgi:hypothetical protein